MKTLLPFLTVLPLSSFLVLHPAAPAPKYAVADIPAALREGAHAVVRADDEVVTVKSAGRLVHTVHRVVTVLDAAGDDFGRHSVSYSALTPLSYLRGAVYDADGRLLHQLRAAEIHDQGMGDAGGSFMTDIRVRYADLRQPSAPYTVEFDYEIVSDNTLFYPDWQPQEEEGVAVQAATLRVTTPSALPLRYQERQLPTGTAVAHATTSGQETYEWKLANLPAVDEEEVAPPLTSLTPAVVLAPGTFEVQGHKGNCATWQGLGQWSYELNAGRDVLPPATLAKVQALVKDAPDVRIRAQRVYEMLQGSTRYISVQLGLGGWQTFPASSVASNGYGDCKALSNYTKALLAAADVPAYVALVGAGSNHPDLRADFPSSQFNHAILCVPMPAKTGRPDTLWLECTSQTDAFGYMGSFTGNRHALLVTPQGGQLVATPRYGATENRQERRLDLFLDATGGATATARTLRTGQEQDLYAQLLHELGPVEQKKYVTDHLRLPTFTLTKFNLAAKPAGQLPGVVETLALSLPGFAQPSGKRVFINPNLLSRMPALPAQVGERQADVWLSRASLHADTVRLHLPVGFRTEDLPAGVQFSTAYGTYASQYTSLPDGTVQYIRRLELKRGHLPKTAYTGYLDFRRKVSIADKGQVVLVKTES
jgi:transglutaminase-like putative cysteine protease